MIRIWDLLQPLTALLASFILLPFCSFLITSASGFFELSALNSLLLFPRYFRSTLLSFFDSFQFISKFKFMYHYVKVDVFHVSDYIIETFINHNTLSHQFLLEFCFLASKTLHEHLKWNLLPHLFQYLCSHF